ncbi:hypothetical protein DYB32_006298 [Aphanomyces invadans]|uniref:Uncharacterized protein n=1 Tax=Aphanomyces invadans TaxID=157072 RepID=A0A3R6WJP8_9STRA|nr:hypothetical protein DYB32_006298 [Aphanomyces invadans]
MTYIATACLLLIVSVAVSSTATPAGPPAASNEGAVVAPEAYARAYNCGCVRLRGGRLFRDDVVDDDDLRFGRLAAVRAGLHAGGSPLWAAGGRAPIVGGQFVAAGHGNRWVAGGAAPRGIQWAATGKLADIRARPAMMDDVITDNAAPVVAPDNVAPVADDTTSPRQLTEYESADYESDEFA